MQLDQQWHGYARGHQLLASSIELDPRDQELIDKLSDSSGSPRPGEKFDPYLTVYPLPSGRLNVVARTWQDLEAPRSGTVFTRSLLIPRNVWRSLPDLRPIFRLLSNKEITKQPAVLELLPAVWPPVEGQGLFDLTEALFLESSAPVAAFGFQDTEDIAGRFLEAVWPNRRETFAVCTYALGPRSLIDRDFDLIFAPDSARARFAKWSGKKIKASPENVVPRHQWTSMIVNRIFYDPVPRLDDLDEIGALESGSRQNGSSLRLALLWADLKQSAATTPKSILGMLDILSSLGRDPWQIPAFLQLVLGAIKRAGASQSVDDWHFLQILARKLGSNLPLSVIRELLSASRTIATHAPEVVLSTEFGMTHAVPHLFRSGVGRGLSDVAPDDLKAILRRSSPETMIALMTMSPPFCRAIGYVGFDKGDADLIEGMRRLISEDNRVARRISFGIAQGAKTSTVAPLLKAAILGSPPNNFSLLTENVFGMQGTERELVLDTLVECARVFRQQEKLREAALRSKNRQEADKILFETIEARTDVTWLIDHLSNEVERLDTLLKALLPKWSEVELRQILDIDRNRDAIITALLDGLPSSLESLILTLKNTTLSPQSSLSIFRVASKKLSSQERASVGAVMLDQLFAIPDESNALLAPLLLKIDVSKIVAAATSSSLPDKLVGANVALLSTGSALERFAPVSDKLTARLVERRTGGYTKAGYDGWARLLRSARKVAPEALVRSADPALDYAISRIDKPTGALVAAAFPIVHARLEKKSNLPDIPLNLFTVLIYASISLFTDWDRAKEARHGVVDAFLRSEWEPAELLRAAMDARVTNKILGYLVSRPGGRDYLRKIEKSALNYAEPTRSSFTKAIAQFKKAK